MRFAYFFIYNFKLWYVQIQLFITSSYESNIIIALCYEKVQIILS